MPPLRSHISSGGFLLDTRTAHSHTTAKLDRILVTVRRVTRTPTERALELAASSNHDCHHALRCPDRGVVR